jgi:flagellar motor switch protein FliN/FliY
MLILKEHDAALITDLLMGGDGHVEQPVVLDEMHMSAISEVMNQMMGASATALSNLLGESVNISTPITKSLSHDDDMSDFLEQEELIVKISFDMVIEGLLQSELLQLMPFGLAKSLSDHLMPGEEEPVAPPPPPPPPAAKSAPAPAPPPAPPAPAPLVNVRTAHYTSFDEPEQPSAETVNGMQMIHDIPLRVTVELGRTSREISEILKFSMGTILVLDKTVGDPVEVFVNGKLLARGEVVVIEDSYGVRITEVMNG